MATSGVMSDKSILSLFLPLKTTVGRIPQRMHHRCRCIFALVCKFPHTSDSKPTITSATNTLILEYFSSSLKPIGRSICLSQRILGQ